MEPFIKNFDKRKLEEAFKIKTAYQHGEIDLAMANAQMKAHVGTLTPGELAYIEQEMQEKVAEECIREDIDTMMAIYEGVLKEGEDYDAMPLNHPIRIYAEENKAISALVVEIEKLIANKYIKNQWDEAFEKLNLFKVHLSRKQNQLYPALEHVGFSRPTETMWLFDNLIRDSITELTDQLKEFKLEQQGTFQENFAKFKLDILDLIAKENEVLYPVSLELLEDKDFIYMAEGDGEIGYCLVDAPAVLYGKGDVKATAPTKDKIAGLPQDKDKLHVAEGYLTLEQINLVFKHMPVDLSYVDENEIVAFYTDTPHRVFPRSKGVIGRQVKNCHPINSVAVVEEIIEKFRSGAEDRVEFWINKPPVFIYIVYVAVRDEEGKFRGVLEMMQDCSRIRQLTGSQTLLNWEQDNTEGKAKPKVSPEEAAIAAAKQAEAADQKDAAKAKELVITEDTKVESLFRAHPGLKEYFISRNDAFKMLKSPMYQLMKFKATVKMAGERTGLGTEGIIQLYQDFLKEENNK